MVRRELAVMMAAVGVGGCGTPTAPTLNGRHSADVAFLHGADVNEISTLLRSWGERRPQPGAAGPPPVPIVGPDQLQRLSTTSGPAFDRMFLQLMAARHRGPLDVARGELAAGRDSQVMRLAQRTVVDQQVEVAEMQALLARV